MRLIRHPWVWFARFRKRKGYGVHSPFAFSFITTVVNERTPFYAYRELSRLHPWWVRLGRFYPVQCRRLLFRLANFAEPQTVCILGECPLEETYIKRAVPHARIYNNVRVRDKGHLPVADFVLVAAERMDEALSLSKEMPENGMLVVEGIHRSAAATRQWHALQAADHTGITFDLYTYGVAFFDPHRHKQHYKVNF